MVVEDKRLKVAVSAKDASVLQSSSLSQLGAGKSGDTIGHIPQKLAGTYIGLWPQKALVTTSGAKGIHEDTF